MSYFRELIGSLDTAIRLITPSVQFSGAAQACALGLQQKAAQIAGVAAKLGNALQTAVDLLSATGFYFLPIPPMGGGVPEFIRQLQSAENEPPFGPEAFTAGVVFLVPAVSYPVLELLFRL